MCHSAASGVFTTSTGTDISPVALWQSTMMANAAKDPLWQAKVTAEVAEHPALQAVIEDKCTTCHMPMGKTEAFHLGNAHFSFEAGTTDPLSMDGVSCTLCHQIQPQNLGTIESFSGAYQITDIHDIFGPYPNPITTTMFNQVGYTPLHSSHVNHSELCATCHTLYTPYVNNQGEVAGYFPEQTPYLEWLNSQYSSQSVYCQTCHMPASPEPMRISSRPLGSSEKRTPIWGHDFVGGNIFMNTLIKANASELGVTAKDSRSDITIEITRQMLQERTVELTAEAFLTGDTLWAEVQVKNLTGHKFPTGFPSRRAWIHLRVTDDRGNPVFESGNWDANGEIIGLDEGCEPHHTVISMPEQVQIYEAVMQDVDNEVTYTLLRGARYHKDNRLPPKGFTRKIPDYASIAVIGSAADDPDFNSDPSGVEGSGTDRVIYKVALTGRSASFTLQAEVCYQTVTPRFVQDLVAHPTSKATAFKTFYEGSSNKPVLLKSISLPVVNTGVHQNNEEIEPKCFTLLKNYPNPFNASTVITFTIQKSGPISLEIYNLRGEKVKTMAARNHSAGEYKITWQGRDDQGDQVPSGIYVAALRSDERISTLRMILLR
ncbi:MAG TPA: FlgD immunoglobulin-like domain containing protein [bacterium]|nr:FlgD immunoglobulin-like domain containing protein [bacterium]HQJ66082.1 FlgD immunoglobulin-like domain containing protein [bacterium]